ncbi:MAG: 3-isopropylmalate dehydratase small subunit [Candidatus Marinimicrobia bacterium]|jgi:3-isopropylmalate/(R)-2-methylmalate dehydratase small subunit|nr:3-isopropylmalate dehydratase small subunit [Candidatus Neomarinimicrobiota bacterium]MBT3676727.1 3-isopropylmalate dehydratase small subunit [Candidatus Neomarinimicrobiota bacterium]MBT3764170.1 3-isopropylmalate dehydratase small subunit [Candidatus Neomarinimicrobiota bacterium]MBT4068520.1 3-isopropylmalate dehydratase small subunit [Candidatus Neomarinimicrobiota bacterium]MBT4271437.1 3-isopropylmalate dehydratase small subunit [Candidatus Neomarinimicrobiota bacterium]
MDKFLNFTGLVAPIDRPNVDTDAIIPKQFLKSIKRTGFGPNLFDEWRYLDKGEPGMPCKNRPLNPDFVLNQDRYQGASILLTRENYGCGSSREHAPWAIQDYGFRVIIGPSFADIFYNNCFKNGLLPIVLSDFQVDELFQTVDQTTGFELAINLKDQTIQHSNSESISFEIDEYKKLCLLHGLDEIDQTMGMKDKIQSFEEKHRNFNPWVFEDLVL